MRIFFTGALTSVLQIILLALLMPEMGQCVRLKDLKLKKMFKHFLRVQLGLIIQVSEEAVRL